MDPPASLQPHNSAGAAPQCSGSGRTADTTHFSSSSPSSSGSGSSGNDAQHTHVAAATMDADTICLVLARLEPRQVAAARRVCRAWRAAAAAAMPISFKRHWGIVRIVGCGVTTAVVAAAAAPAPANGILPPRRGRCALMERATLASFVRRVRVGRGDSILSIALKHGVAPADVKRANGLISDHGLHAHRAVLVPAATPADLQGQCVRLEHVAAANRDVAVLVDADEAAAISSGDEDDTGGGGDDGPHTSAGGGRGTARRRRPQPSARETQRLAQLLARSTVLRGDGSAALYYLEASGGDVKAALSAAAADEAWEDTTPGPIRLAPVAAYINGEAGL